MDERNIQLNINNMMTIFGDSRNYLSIIYQRGATNEKEVKNVLIVCWLFHSLGKSIISYVKKCACKFRLTVSRFYTMFGPIISW